MKVKLVPSDTFLKGLGIDYYDALQLAQDKMVEGYTKDEATRYVIHHYNLTGRDIEQLELDLP